MRKNYLLIAFLFLSFQLFSQEAYFLAGSNFTKYVFKSSDGGLTSKLQNGTGSTYEMGYATPIIIKGVYLNIGLTLNDYNTVSGTQSESYTWNTKYIGIQNGLSYNYSISEDFELSVKGGLGLSSIIYGKQNINGTIHDLVGQDEFSGVFISPFIGAQTRFKLNEIGYLSLGYAYTASLNPFNSSKEKLSFTTNQILFGIHFNINKN